MEPGPLGLLAPGISRAKGDSATHCHGECESGGLRGSRWPWASRIRGGFDRTLQGTWPRSKGNGGSVTTQSPDGAAPQSSAEDRWDVSGARGEGEQTAVARVQGAHDAPKHRKAGGKDH
jgi:hypothetical protein